MRVFLTILIVSLLTFSLSTNAREHTIFGGLIYWDTEAIETVDIEDSTDETATVTNVVTSGSLLGLRVFYQTFAQYEGLYLGAGLQFADGDYSVCVQEDCVGFTQTVDDINVELGWSSRQWTSYLELIWSDTQSDLPRSSESDSNFDFGVGAWLQSDKNRLMLKINGLRDNDKQTIEVGFQRKLRQKLSIEGSYNYSINSEFSGYGVNVSVGWIFYP